MATDGKANGAGHYHKLRTVARFGLHLPAASEIGALLRSNVAFMQFLRTCQTVTANRFCWTIQFVLAEIRSSGQPETTKELTSEFVFPTVSLITI
jgi:hypothetical protein